MDRTGDGFPRNENVCQGREDAEGIGTHRRLDGVARHVHGQRGHGRRDTERQREPKQPDAARGEGEVFSGAVTRDAKVVQERDGQPGCSERADRPDQVVGQREYSGKCQQGAPASERKGPRNQVQTGTAVKEAVEDVGHGLDALGDPDHDDDDLRGGVGGQQQSDQDNCQRR